MYAHIVAGTDGTATSRHAVEHAADLARLTGATLHLVHAYRLPSHAPLVAPEMTAMAMASDGDARDGAESLVAALAEQLRQDGVAVCAHVCAGAAADALCGVAETEAADLVVVGNKGMKGARRILGSVPNAVAHKATCAVLVVPTT